MLSGSWHHPPMSEAVDPNGKEEWFYCLQHRRVEGRGECRVDQRLGPFPTKGEAERALDRVQRRNVAWDNDPDWTDPDD
jgi:hypothetical protein